MPPSWAHLDLWADGALAAQTGDRVRWSCYGTRQHVWECWHMARMCLACDIALAWCQSRSVTGQRSDIHATGRRSRPKELLRPSPVHRDTRASMCPPPSHAVRPLTSQAGRRLCATRKGKIFFSVRTYLDGGLLPLRTVLSAADCPIGQREALPTRAPEACKYGAGPANTGRGFFLLRV